MLSINYYYPFSLVCLVDEAPVVNRSRMAAGFSMVELSFVIAIVSLLTVGGLSVGVSVVDQKRQIDTQVQQEEIVEALKGFYRVNARLPCPADPTLTVDDSNFGQEIACATGAGVHTGDVPVRALGLSESFSHDWWFNRYTYVVSRNHTNAGTFGSVGAVEVRNAANEVIFSNALFAVVSHGEDGKGAYRHKTATASTCTAGADDTENCDGDATVVDAVMNDGEVAANFYDDHISWGSIYVLESAEEMDPTVGLINNNQTCHGSSGVIQCDWALWTPSGANAYFNNAQISAAGTLRDANGGWVRTYNNTGWYNGTHGGGWHMTDTTWLRSYNNKSIYTGQEIRAGNILRTQNDAYVEDDLFVGENGGGDSRIHMYDDNSNAWRVFYWDDSINYFRFNSNVFMDGILNMASDRIVNVSNPVSNQDAATKKYVDDRVATAGGGGSNTCRWLIGQGKRCDLNEYVRAIDYSQGDYMDGDDIRFQCCDFQ